MLLIKWRPVTRLTMNRSEAAYLLIDMMLMCRFHICLFTSMQFRDSRIHLSRNGVILPFPAKPMEFPLFQSRGGARCIKGKTSMCSFSLFPESHCLDLTSFIAIIAKLHDCNFYCLINY